MREEGQKIEPAPRGQRGRLNTEGGEGQEFDVPLPNRSQTDKYLLKGCRL